MQLNSGGAPKTEILLKCARLKQETTRSRKGLYLAALPLDMVQTEATWVTCALPIHHLPSHPSIHIAAAVAGVPPALAAPASPARVAPVPTPPV